MTEQTGQTPELRVGRLHVRLSALVFAVSRSSGPGGQNVNKQNTRIELRLPITAVEGASPAILQRFIMLAGKRLSGAGELRIVCQQTRSLEQNRAIALEQLTGLLEEANKVPRPRRATRPSYGSRRRRIEGKIRRSEVKAHRQGKPE